MKLLVEIELAALFFLLSAVVMWISHHFSEMSLIFILLATVFAYRKYLIDVLYYLSSTELESRVHFFTQEIFIKILH